MSNNYAYLFKATVIGDARVGKSCIVQQFGSNKFQPQYETTIGVEFVSKIIAVGEYPTKLQIWDTAGTEQFRAMTRSYYRDSVGIIIVYDITNGQSFANVPKWLEEAKEYSHTKHVIMLVGNKKDLANKRSVSYEEGSSFAHNNGMEFLECSASTGDNIDTLFQDISGIIINKIYKGEIDPTQEFSGIKLGKQIEKFIKKQQNV